MTVSTTNPTPPTESPATPGLLTVEDLAARWQVTVERALRRLKHSDLRALNLGTAKNPEIRFRLESVRAWEESYERMVAPMLGGDEPDEPGQGGSARPAPPPAPARGSRLDRLRDRR